MPSFDIVSEMNAQECDNALQQSRKEILGRWDLKGTGTDIELLADGSYVVKADEQMHGQAAYEIFLGKLAKRGVALEHFQSGNFEAIGHKMVKMAVSVKKGIESDSAKKIVAFIKESKIKVQASIQGETVRVTGKNRDDLQEVMQRVRATSFGLPLQFQNFRD
jgi:uncharacterized protein YajQ (UPF0234 family)